MRRPRTYLILSLVVAVLTGLAAAAPAAVRIGRHAAAAGSLPRISGEENVGGTLSASTGSWRWTPKSYAYQWLLCNAQAKKCQPLRGLTTRSIEVPAAAAGLRLRVKVTAIGTVGTARATSNPSATIGAARQPAPLDEEPSSPGDESSPPAGESTPPSDGESAPPSGGDPGPPSGGDPEPPSGGNDPPAPPPSSGSELFRESFSYPDGLVTNEYATWNPGSSQAKTSSTWEMTSGSLFAQGGTGWTGVPDGCSSASASSSPCTASDVFRLNTLRQDFGNVTVSLDLRSNHLTSSSRTPAVNWDGIHVWLHYQSEYQLYYASFNRRDGHIVIKKKCPGGSENGGTYYELAPGEVSGYPIQFGSWQHLAAAIRDNSNGSVTITMWRDGTQLLSATDTGVGCAPITAAGGVGIRGDNDDFNVDNFIVTQN